MTNIVNRISIIYNQDNNLTALFSGGGVQVGAPYFNFIGPPYGSAASVRNHHTSHSEENIV